MQRFVTTFRMVRTIKVPSDAEDRDGALAAARATLPLRCDGTVPQDWRPTEVERLEADDEGTDAVVDAWEVVGPCELCERTLFDDEGRSLGEDAGDACPACYAEVQAEHARRSNRSTCDTAWWCPACSYGVELGEAAQTDLVPTADTKAVCPVCGTELEAA